MSGDHPDGKLRRVRSASSRAALGFGLLGVLVGALVYGCGGSDRSSRSADKIGGEIKGIEGDDRSRCDFRGRADREVTETAAFGAIQPNVRRVFAIVGEGEDRRKVLLCREIDTNLDGKKDVVRTYTDKGEALNELADSDYDGSVDTWVTFARGRINKVQSDTNKDARPDETRFYVGGKLSRAQRDTNHDGKPDVWEIYDQGSLQRMGVDLDFDGHVDRWDRDEIAMHAAADREREEMEREEAQKKREQGPDLDAGAGGAVTDARVSARNR
jgi:hypothetical protein